MKNTFLKMMFVGVLATTLATSCSSVQSTTNKIENVVTSDAILGNWELSSLSSLEGKSLIDNFSAGAPYINFISKDVVSAFDGCNVLNGGVEVKGNTVKFGNLMSSLRACEGVNDRAFSSELVGTLTYKIQDDVLSFMKDGKVVMQFVRPGQLNGTWVLEEFIGKDRSLKTLDQRFPNQKPTLKFEDGSVSGTNGCNTFSGNYQVVGESLKMGPIMATRMFCEGVDDSQFDDRLQNATSFKKENGKLVIYSNGVKAMTFGNMIQPR